MDANTDNQFSFVDNQADLDALVKRLQGVEWIALDTEADSLHHYYEKVCLIQITADKLSYIVDPLANLKLSGLLKVLAHKKLILHGAEYDLRMLLASFKFKPKGEVFDTMLAAQLIEGQARSLVALAERLLDVTLTKQGQKSDWSRRPLTERQLNYASNDTRYLDAIACKLNQELIELGRQEWHAQYCRQMVLATGREKPPPDPERVWRIKGLSDLDRKQLAYVREIWYWRDAEARRTDSPPFKVMGNALILELALWSAANRNRRVKNGPKLPRNCVNRRFDSLEKAINKARALTESDYPDFRRGNGNPPPEYGPELDVLRAECVRLGQELGVEASLIASRRTIEAIVLARPHTKKELQAAGKLMDWQVDLLAPKVQELF